MPLSANIAYHFLNDVTLEALEKCETKSLQILFVGANNSWSEHPTSQDLSDYKWTEVAPEHRYVSVTRTRARSTRSKSNICTKY